MPGARLTVAQAIPLIATGPKRIAAAVADIPTARLRSERMLDVWTATEVLAHLRSCADVFLDVVPRILAADHPRLDVVGPRDPARVAGYRDAAFTTSLRTFIRQRERIVAMPRALPVSAGARSALIVDRGRRRERTIREYADWLARHEQRHVEEFERFGRKVARQQS